MQLDKVVSYHKALADPTRIRMLILLAVGELNGQLLAEKLSVTPATITHHAAKLREASLINERREKNTIYFSLNRHFIQSGAEATLNLIHKNGGADPLMQPTDKRQKMQDSVLRSFFTAEGQLKQIPSQLKKKLIVLHHLAMQLEKGRKYTEKELNVFIQQFHPDFATLRREFIMHQFMFRDTEVYELNPEEMWTRWETLS